MHSFRFPLLLGVFAFFLTSCDAATGVFNTGAYTGLIGVVLIIALVISVISKTRGGSGST